MRDKTKEKIKILIIGNGFGGTYALKNLHKFFHKSKNVELSLVGDKNYFLFTPLLHEVATGGINPENIIEPMRKVLTCCLANFYLGRVESVNLKEHTVKVGVSSIGFDYLILAPGAQTNFYDIPGAQEHCFTLKTIEDAIKLKNHFISQMDKATHENNKTEKEKSGRFIIVGGGPTGVELAAELHEFITGSLGSYYSKKLIQDTSVVLVQRDPELLPQFGERMRRKSLQVLRKKGIEVRLQAEVKEVTASGITLNDGTHLASQTIIWTAGIKPNKINFTEEMESTPDGRLIVNEYLQIEKHKNIFAIGDITAFKDSTSGKYLPALAQVAEKEAKSVAENIKLLIEHSKLKPFAYKSSGYLISLGQWMAAGEISGITFSGHLTWWLWRTVYLSKLISWNKKMKVAFDWTINIFSSRDISQI